LNVLREGEGVSFTEQDRVHRSEHLDEAALNELEKLGYMTTPVTVIDGEVVIGFDAPKLRSLLKLDSGR
jgi:glutaredoxin